MPDIKDILRNEDFGSIVGDLCVDTREDRNPREYMEEYEGDRTRRKESVGYRESKKIAVYSDTEKEVDPETGEEKPKRLEDKTVEVAQTVTNLPKKIVRTSVAFLFGGEMTITAEDPNDGFSEFKKVYKRKLKMKSVLKEFARKVLSETKAAIVFYPVTRDDGKSQLKVKILSTPKDSNTECEFYPHFDEDDDMDGFLYKYNAEVDGRTCECVKIYTKDTIYSGIMDGIWKVKRTKNRFGKIPVVYAEVDCPDWDDVANLIDKKEMRLSRLSDTNDYFSEPILKTYGLANLPSKETVGKELNFGIEVDADTGTSYHGDADYLAWQQSCESVTLELNQLDDAIHSGASSPDLSMSKLMGLGNQMCIRDSDNVLIAGNGVYEEAQKLGLKVRVVESDGTELIVIKRKDLSTEDEKRKMLALADNHTFDSSEFDWGLVIENFSSDILNDWEFSVDDIEFSTDIPNIDSEKDSNLYTKKIVSPIYTPTGNKPAISELYNLETYNCLMKQIKECNLDKQTKDFLQIAASRHIVFDYGKIAEFYAHSDAIIQNLMEDSALVIIDFNKAIELGYVCLKKELSDSYLEDHNDDEK